jgi:hypothetical protein
LEFIALTSNGYCIIESDTKSQANKNLRKHLQPNEFILWVTQKNKTKETMTVATQELSLPEVSVEVAQQKRTAWGELGVKIANADLQLQARAQQAIAKLFTPTKIEEVVKAEALLKEIKAEALAIQNSRKEITNPVNNRMSELMLPEKSFDEPLKKVEQAIISLKKSEQERQQKENQRLQELKNCREWLTTTRNNADAAFKNLNIDKVGKVYAHALGAGDISLDMVPEYIKFAIGRRTIAEFDYEFPKNTYQLVKPEEFQAMCTELLVFDASIYLADYENQLKAKFSDYAVALKNKEQALALSKQEAEKKTAEIQSQTQNANVAAKIESVAVTPVVSVATKALKQSYAIDMPETVESVIAIMTAFTAHIDKCLPKLNVNKWFAFTPAQAGAAIAKVKTEDENFNPAGITFKTVDKL